MRRNKKFYDGKEVRRIYREYSKHWENRFQYGEWKKVEPYQIGWYRYFVLRKDISRRTDAKYIQKALDLVNTKVFCKDKNFERRDWRTNKKKPISQTLKYLSERDYNKLEDRVRKYLERRIYYEKRWDGRKVEKIGYTLRHEYWAVFHIEPCMVYEQWVPDPNWESKYGELCLKIERHNLWPKISKELGWRSRRWYSLSDYYVKNKYGEIIDIGDIDIEDVA